MGRGRKAKGRPVSGWLVLDKPYEMGSTDAVSKVRRMFGAAKAGHAGTLDPLASGLLPIALGEATKTVPYVTDGTKSYRFTVRWGAETTTDDLEGTETDTSDLRPDEASVAAALPAFIGAIEQVPPQYSAVRIDGERAYDVARDGREAAIKPRVVEIDSLTLLKHTSDETELECVCGKGTYIRAIARDLGRALGCFGHVSALRRTDVFPFTEDDAVTFDDLEAALDAGRAAREAALDALGLPHDTLDDDPALPIGTHLPSRFAEADALLLDAADALEGLPEITLTGEQARRVRLGNAVLLPDRIAGADEPDAFATERGVLIAIGEVRAGTFHPRRVIANPAR